MTDEQLALVRTVAAKVSGTQPEWSAALTALLHRLSAAERERDDLFDHVQRLWDTDEGMLRAEIGSLALHVDTLKEQVSAVELARDEAKRMLAASLHVFAEQIRALRTME